MARVVIAAGVATALLLLGAAAGLLIAGPARPSEPAPGAVDVGFAQDMSMHHQQAVTMATLARERGGDAEVRGLAFDIETNQRDQIGRMQGWLNLWGQPPQASGPPMQWMHGGEHQRGGEHQHGGMAAGAGMPGMADSAELARLRTLRGPAFDTEFLRLMLRHHEGGAPMARYGAEHAALAPVRGLASNMLGSQATESELMRAMLAARGAAPLPPG
ncbi:DUF305 domain-containing protein [Saccharopolyspora sp. HNM0986]|uniref:DUF305 domain-containing protein n=2 Tax=Saccharopolyspora TaxID=1835 RepID=UPI00190A40E3|nr:DUF305 domain-containing protein [Saccharopolyspora sp. HNM0986]MBK0867662.1 DUF305 domain-containing protein [Saccharopolyspora sp. HNM0986]